MFYTGLDPRNMKPVFIPRQREEKLMQRALLQYKKPQNYDLVQKALLLAGRKDLIGFGPKCLIKPRDDTKNTNGRALKSKQKNTNKMKLNSTTKKRSKK